MTENTETPLVSVIICTYNRARLLRQAMDSVLAAFAQAPAKCELVVVNNNSSDDTAAVAAGMAAAHPGAVRVFLERRQGLSQARNTGITNARGKILFFTDDDCRVDPDWIAVSLRTFDEARADCVFGKVLPVWPRRRPNWLAAEPFFWSKLALLDYGDLRLEADSIKRQFFGANFAVSKEALLAAGVFDTTLGRVGSSLFAGEDTRLCENLLKHGKTIVYEPGSRVNHVIEPERLSVRYFLRWHFFAGQSLVAALPRRTLFTLPRWYHGKSFRVAADLALALPGFDRARILRHVFRLASQIGGYYYALRR